MSEEELVECPECEGEGFVAGLPCFLCLGAGLVESSYIKEIGYDAELD